MPTGTPFSDCGEDAAKALVERLALDHEAAVSAKEGVPNG